MRTRFTSATDLRPVAHIALIALAVVAVVSGVAHTNRAGMSSDPGYETFLGTVRSGVLASVPASTSRRAAGDGAHAFIAARSGAVVDDATRAHLARLDEEYVQSGAHAVTADELGARLADWLLDDVLVTLTPDEVTGAIEAWRGFDAPDLPASFKQGRTEVRLEFAEPAILLTPLEARQAVESLQTSEDARETLRAELRERVAARVVERVGYLNAADPSRFRADRLSPVEAMVIVYSAVSNDLLAGTNAELRDRMRSLKSAADRMNPTPFPTPDGRLPYGTNGYLVSTPLDCLLARARRLVDRLE